MMIYYQGVFSLEVQNGHLNVYLNLWGFNHY